MISVPAHVPVLAALLVLLGVLGVWLSWTAGRLDRLHARVDAARAVFDAQLLRRSGAVLELTASGALDPATSLVLADVAHRAQAAEPPRGLAADAAYRSGRAASEAREESESDLTRVLDSVLDSPEAVEELRAEGLDLDELAAACRRVAQARRFHNDVVRAAVRLRQTRRARWFRLAGRAPLPLTVELADEVPRGLRH